MKFNNIDEAVTYLINSVPSDTKYTEEDMIKTKNFLCKFIHSPKMKNLELEDDSEQMKEFKRRHPHNKVVNSNTLEIKLFDFDEKVMIFVSIGDLYNNGSFTVEADMYDLFSSEIKSNKEAIELLEYYNSIVPYDEMNDAIDYHRNYRAMKDKKSEKNGEIMRKFENFDLA